MKNNAFHINSYFLTNRIHYHFLKVIKSYRQDIFLIPVYKHFKEKHINDVDIDYVFSDIDKKLFFTKMFKVLYLYFQKHSNSSFKYIHAHTLISDGIPAYLIGLITKKKFIVSVRGTDVNYFIARSSIFKLIAKAILSKASIVFFVSPSYKNKIANIYPGIDASKFLLLPNGIAPFWTENTYKKDSISKKIDIVNILFVGRVSKQKNLDILIDLLSKYNDRAYNLTIVGPNDLEWNFESISQSVCEGNTINYVGEVKSVDKLLSIYRENDVFVMLSPCETFGVVYVEAMSQGLPIIYTRGDGIDGYFKEGEVGYSCNHESLEELKEKMELVLLNYSKLSINATQTAGLFEWNHLIKNYMKNVDSVLNI